MRHRPALAPLSLLYGAAVGLKNAAYDRQVLTARRLRNPVISIGNLSVGGAGKTPLVIELVRLLSASGRAVDVLSRGYGRSSNATERVDLEAPNALSRFGDEPLLIASATDSAVYVGASRYQAGLLAEQDAPRLHLLDDGFQHRKLHRDVDIVVLHRSDFHARLLPAGRLREPLSSLRRASILVLRTEDADVEANLRRLGLAAPVWRMHRRLVLPERLGACIAFCGIARPDEFFGAIPGLLTSRAFPDHHRYSDRDIEELAGLARRHHASTLLTTEKDLVRLSPAQRAVLAQSGGRSGSLAAARLEVSLDERGAASTLLSLLPRQ